MLFERLISEGDYYGSDRGYIIKQADGWKAYENPTKKGCSLATDSSIYCNDFSFIILSIMVIIAIIGVIFLIKGRKKK